MIQVSRRNVIIFAVAIVGLLLVWLIVTQLTRIGKIAVTIESSPQNATIKINGKSAHTGTNYLSAGSYTFSAEKSGYSKAEQVTIISDANNYIALLPTPVSEEAKKEANSENESARAQTISGIASGRAGEALRKNNPIITKLPYSDISGPFKIDYGYDQDDADRIYLIVSYASPNGRQRAIRWLKDNKANITSTEVIFQDFTNPVAISSEEHHD